MVGAIPLALLIVSTTVNVDNYLDSNEAYQQGAIRRAAAAAGEGGEVLFTAGKTYTLSGHVGQYQDQVWRTEGDGIATIRRADEAQSVLLADALAGSISIQVADPNQFAAKQFISPATGGGGYLEGQSSPTHIKSITGNTILLDRPLSTDYRAGDPVVSAHRLVNMAAGSVLENLRIDGNAAGNDTFVSWVIHQDVVIGNTADGAKVRNIEIVNSQGNSITVAADDVIIENSRFEGANLAGVHLSSTSQFQWIDNQAIATNQQAERGGHSAGAITISLNNRDISIDGGLIENVPAYGVGTAHPGANVGFKVTNVTFSGNDGIWQSQTTTGWPTELELLYRHNTAIDSGEILVKGQGGQVIEGIAIEDSLFIGSGINLRNASDVTLFRNSFDEASWQTLVNVTPGIFSPADADGDGDVDTADLTTMLQSFTGAGVDMHRTMAEGDTDGDGDVDTYDITLGYQQFTGQLPFAPGANYEALQLEPVAVPEPGSESLAAMGLLALVLCGAAQASNRKRVAARA